MKRDLKPSWRGWDSSERETESGGVGHVMLMWTNWDHIFSTAVQ